MRPSRLKPGQQTCPLSRVPAVAGLLIAALLDAVWCWGQARGSWPTQGRSAWLRRWSKRTLRVMNVRVTAWGSPPATGLLVSNHTGYQDVVVLAAVQPLVFVAKREEWRWAGCRALARLAGTLFVDREERSDGLRLGVRYAPFVNQGSIVAVFPEGASSPTGTIQPFHSALLAPAASVQWPATPVWIGYAFDDEADETEAHRSGKSFRSCVLNLLGRRELRAMIIYGDPVSNCRERRLLARELHRRVHALAAEGRRMLD